MAWIAFDGVLLTHQACGESFFRLIFRAVWAEKIEFIYVKSFLNVLFFEVILEISKLKKKISCNFFFS